MQATTASAEATAAALLAFWKRIMRAGGSRGFFAVLDELDLSPTQTKVLFALEGCDAHLTVKQLADLVPTSLPNASRTADALLRRGFVERQEDPLDRRQKRLHLTPAGREVVARIDSVRLQDMSAFCAGLPEEDRALLLQALTALEGRR